MGTFDFEAIKDLLRCPKSRAELVEACGSLVSCDPGCRLRYPIVEGFPVLLIDEAMELSMPDWSAAMTAAGRDPMTGADSAAGPPKGPR